MDPRREGPDFCENHRPSQMDVCCWIVCLVLLCCFCFVLLLLFRPVAFISFLWRLLVCQWDNYPHGNYPIVTWCVGFSDISSQWHSCAIYALHKLLVVIASRWSKQVISNSLLDRQGNGLWFCVMRLWCTFCYYMHKHESDVFWHVVYYFMFVTPVGLPACTSYIWSPRIQPIKDKVL